MSTDVIGNVAEKAGLGSRFAAVLIDGIIIGVVAVVLTMVLAAVALSGGADGAMLAAIGLSYIVFPVLIFLYYIVMEATYGATLGKLALGIVVTTEDGRKIGWGDSIVRNLLRIVDALPFLYLIGAILISTNDDNQRIGDMVADTLVVEKAR